MSNAPIAAHSNAEYWPSSRLFVLRVVVVLTMLIGMSLLANQNLPDYEAYQNSYASTEDIEGFNPLFLWLTRTTTSLGLTYEEFRLFCGFLGGLLLFLLANRAHVKKSDRSNALYFLCAFAVLTFMFIFEFYEVRLRGGLSALLFMLALLPEFNSARAKLRIALRIVQTVLVCGSFVFHPPTTASLILFALPALCYLKYRPSWLKPAPVIFGFGVLAAWFVLFYFIVNTAAGRGDWLFSPLNPARFFALSAIPALLFILLDLPASRHLLRETNGFALYPFLFSTSYLLGALVMTVFFVIGQLNLAGEAVVRVMTLSSFPAALVIGGWGLGYGRILPAYLLACNGLFFLNSVYL